MTYEEMIKGIEKVKKDRKAFKNGELKGKWTEDMHKDFLERCDSQDKPLTEDRNN